MLKRLFCCALLLVNQVTFAANTPPLPFKSPEHLQIGEAVALQFPDQPAKQAYVLHLPNGVALTYGEILSLGGDYYGVVDAPIALGNTPAEQQRRFMADFDTLATDLRVSAEVKAMLDLVYAEMNDIQQGIQNGENPTDVYARISTDYNIRRNCVTGGFCPADHPNLPADTIHKIYFLKPGRSLQLANKDFDHFNAEALIAYRAGHAAAIQTAINAHASHVVPDLEKAYAMNAFACHFLSDIFAPGHMRTPRLQLYNGVLTHTVGSLLSNYMHREDNTHGLIVRNKRGDTWKAYGDAYFMDERNQKTRALLHEAMQASADDIFFAFQTGQAPTVDRVAAIVPDLELLNSDKNNRDNLAPLFYWDKHKHQLLRRTHLNEIQRYEWTAVWSGWETLVELIHFNGMPGIEANALIAEPTTRDQTLKSGLITTSDLQYISNYQQVK